MLCRVIVSDLWCFGKRRKSPEAEVNSSEEVIVDSDQNAATIDDAVAEANVAVVGVSVTESAWKETTGAEGIDEVNVENPNALYLSGTKYTQYHTMIIFYSL